MTRISVFIDGANFHYGVRSINKRYTDFKFDFERFIKDYIGKNQLIDIYYYNASLKKNKDPELFKQQQLFFERLRKIEHLTIILCKRQRRTTKEGNETFTIKGDDIHLAIDMLRDAYENKFDTAILISGDGDFSYLVKYVRKKGKRVENFHFVNNISLDLIKECNANKSIDKKTINKYFFRETQTTLGDTPFGKIIKEAINKNN